MENNVQIYLDHAATQPLSQPVKEYILSILDIYGNPSSLHQAGTAARQILSNARVNTARFINADVNNIYFTSGGSASNTLGIKGFCQLNSHHIFYSPTVHKSILKLLESTTVSNRKTQLKVSSDGTVDLKELEYEIAGRKPFVIIDYANSEIGTIQDVKAIIDLVHFYKGMVYLDCTGSIPAIPLDVKELDADICGFSAHKLGALKGCGVLYKKADIKLEPLIYGSQEQGLVGGTENVLGIASLDKAVEGHNYASITSYHRDYVYDHIVNNIPNSYLVGASIESGKRLPHNLYMCFKDIDGESLMLLLDMNGIQVSTGSACNNGNLTASAALSAIGMDEQDIHSCIRMTFSGQETREELEHVCQTLTECISRIKAIGEII